MPLPDGNQRRVERLAKPVGKRGSWFATWEGKEYPCVHVHWAKGRPTRYVDPGVSDDPHWPPFIQAIRSTKVVILTQDKVVDGSFTRTGYVGLFAVDDVEVDANELRFTFVDRITDFA